MWGTRTCKLLWWRALVSELCSWRRDLWEYSPIPLTHIRGSAALGFGLFWCGKQLRNDNLQGHVLLNPKLIWRPSKPRLCLSI